jgi:hypothetical protein
LGTDFLWVVNPKGELVTKAVKLDDGGVGFKGVNMITVQFGHLFHHSTQCLQGLRELRMIRPEVTGAVVFEQIGNYICGANRNSDSRDHISKHI